MSEQFDLVIIGAGPGGYSTALRAAELGMKVALIERDATVGGTCLNRGCIPSKALITATHTIDTVHHAAELGVNASVNGIDFGTLRDYRLRVVKTMVGGLAGLLAHRGITVFRANAAFHADETAPATSNHIVHLVPSPDQSDILTYHKADVPEPSGPTMDLTATNIVIATGAKPRPLPGNPFAGALIDSTQALEVNEFPSSAVIIGAGAIALEFASMWNAAGSKVTLLIRKDRVLSAWDRRAGTTLTRELKRHGVNIITRASVTHVDTGANLGATVHYTREGQDGEQSVWGEIALVAIGVLSNMQKAGFNFPQEPVWIDPKTKDAIWRGTSMNGIYLIGEGEYGRIMKAMDRQEHDIKGVTAGSSIPVYRISVGHGPKQVPLDKLRSTVTKSKSYEPTNHKNALIAKIHPRRRFLLTKAEMETLNDRLRTLQAKKGYAIPKGMDPNRPQKISRRAMRGR